MRKFSSMPGDPTASREGAPGKAGNMRRQFGAGGRAGLVDVPNGCLAARPGVEGHGAMSGAELTGTAQGL